MQRRYSLTRRDFRRLRDRAIRAQQRDQSEICGVLFADGSGRISIAFLQNASPRPLHFEIDNAKLREARETARRAGLRFVGTFHSHPVGFARPGATDLKAPLRHLQLIFDVCAREAKLWKIKLESARRTAVEVPFTISASPN
jgi:proteasome lid subunit RPN8/RPN11